MRRRHVVTAPGHAAIHDVALLRAADHCALHAAYAAAEKSADRKPPKLGSDAERVAFLFERYRALTSLLPAAKAKRAKRKRESS